MGDGGRGSPTPTAPGPAGAAFNLPFAFAITRSETFASILNLVWHNCGLYLYVNSYNINQ